MTHDLPPPIQQVRAQVSEMLNRRNQGEPIAATVAFQVKKEKEQEFAKRLCELAAATRQLSGLKLFEYHRVDPGWRSDLGAQYLIYEEWDSTAVFRPQWDSDHLKKFQASVLQYVDAPPDLIFYEGSSQPGKSPILQTGQKQAYSLRGHPIPARKTGQDAEYKIGVPFPTPRFQDNGDGTVTDKLTNLIWLKNADHFGEVTWERALKNAQSLASGAGNLSDGSKAGDWRLANLRELLSLIDYGSVNPIIPAGHPFANVRSAIYWTSTTLAPAPKLAWMMTLGIGPTVFDLKTSESARMWPVRGTAARVPKTGQKECWDTHGNKLDSCSGTGQDGDIQAGVEWPRTRFSPNGDGTVTDHLTGLVWLETADPFGLRTWEEALNLCNRLCDGHYDLTDGSRPFDWRLPNIREMESLIDYNRFGPCLPEGHPFRDLRPSSYWTSTSVESAPTEAMFVILGVGPSIFESKEHPFYVWPVRNQRPRR